MTRGRAVSLLLLLIISGAILVPLFMKEEPARYGQDKHKTGAKAGHTVSAGDLKEKLLTKDQYEKKRDSLKAIPFEAGSVK